MIVTQIANVYARSFVAMELLELVLELLLLLESLVLVVVLASLLAVVVLASLEVVAFASLLEVVVLSARCFDVRKWVERSRALVVLVVELSVVAAAVVLLVVEVPVVPLTTFCS